MHVIDKPVVARDAARAQTAEERDQVDHRSASRAGDFERGLIHWFQDAKGADVEVLGADELGASLVQAAEVLVTFRKGVVDARVLVVDGDRLLEVNNRLRQAPAVRLPGLFPERIEPLS